MIDLLRTDLRRAFRDKLVVVLCIIGGVFSIITPLLYKALFLLLKIDGEFLQELETLGIMVNAKTMFFSSFSLGNNFGLVLPVFVAIIVCRDFSNGTIRNKIICGKSRISIYCSLLITTVVLTCSFMLAHALVTLLISLIFFEYQSTPFTINDFGYLTASLGLELLILILVSALLVLLIVLMKNTALSIVMYFVIDFAFIIIGGITQAIGMFAKYGTLTYKVLEFVNTANPFATLAIGGGVNYQLKELLYLILPNLALIIATVVLGTVIFKNKDLK